MSDDSHRRRTPYQPKLNQTTRDWYTRAVTLSETKGLIARFFAEFILSAAEGLRMTVLRSLVVRCTNVLPFGLVPRPSDSAGCHSERSAATKNLATSLARHEILRLCSASAQTDSTPQVHIDGVLVDGALRSCFGSAVVEPAVSTVARRNACGFLPSLFGR